jgi:hypothetical protein
MTRAFVTVIALFLVAGATGLAGAGTHLAPSVASFAQLDTAGSPARAPRLGVAAMIVLTAADTDRGRTGLEQRTQEKKKAARVEAEPSPAKVLPERGQYADVVELAALMAGGFILGLAGFVLGRVWSGIITAGLSGLAVVGAVYAFAFSSQVAQPNIAGALLIFSACALAPNLLGRAGLAAARRLFTGRRSDAADASTTPYD